jgi:predicted transcriptional regulator
MKDEIKRLVLLDIDKILSMPNEAKASHICGAMTSVLFHENSGVTIQVSHRLDAKVVSVHSFLFCDEGL